MVCGVRTSALFILVLFFKQIIFNIKTLLYYPEAIGDCEAGWGKQLQSCVIHPPCLPIKSVVLGSGGIENGMFKRQSF